MGLWEHSGIRVWPEGQQMYSLGLLTSLCLNKWDKSYRTHKLGSPASGNETGVRKVWKKYMGNNAHPLTEESGIQKAPLDFCVHYPTSASNKGKP